MSRLSESIYYKAITLHDTAHIQQCFTFWVMHFILLWHYKAAWSNMTDFD
jgi:hypothetical protein